MKEYYKNQFLHDITVDYFPQNFEILNSKFEDTFKVFFCCISERKNKHIFNTPVLISRLIDPCNATDTLIEKFLLCLTYCQNISIQF